MSPLCGYAVLFRLQRSASPLRSPAPGPVPPLRGFRHPGLSTVWVTTPVFPITRSALVGSLQVLTTFRTNGRVASSAARETPANRIHWVRTDAPSAAETAATTAPSANQIALSCTVIPSVTAIAIPRTSQNTGIIDPTNDIIRPPCFFSSGGIVKTLKNRHLLFRGGQKSASTLCAE